jgi:hypothetical protein
MTRVAATLSSEPGMAQTLTSPRIAGSLEEVGLDGLAKGTR